MRKTGGHLFFAVAAVTLLHAERCPQAAGADAGYPAKSIRLVIPFAAGGGPDVVGRILGDKVSQNLGQNIVMDNRGGAGGMLGADIVAKSPPDGYTLLLHVAGYASYPFFYKSVPYNSEKDLLPVTMVAKSVGFVLVISPNLGVASVKDLVALAKASSGNLNFAAPGRGSPGHLAAELFAQMAGVKLTPVFYTGVPAALSDVIGGRVTMSFPAAPSALPLIQAGRLQVLGITAARRWNKMPNLPTLNEAGISGMNFVGWYGLWFLAGTPNAIIDRMQDEVARAVRDPVVQQRFEEQGLEAVGSTRQEFATAIREEFELNRKLAAQIGIVPE